MTPTRFQTLIDAGVLEIGDGYRAKNEELGGDGYLFLRAGHVCDTHISFEGVERFRRELNDKLKIKLSKAGDTVITTKGNSTGRTAFVTDDMPTFVYSPHLSYWRSRDPDRIENGFLRYWSRGDEFQGQLDGMSESTDMAPYLSLTDQRRLKITLPKIKEQRAIARVLGALDDKIELNRRLNRSLEELAEAVFGIWLERHTTTITSIRAQELIDSGVLVVGDGYRAKRVELADHGLPFARAGNVDDGFDFDDAELLGPPGVAAAREKVSEVFDAVFTSKGTVGRFAQVLPTTPRFVYAPQLCFWRVLKPERLSPHVLFQWMKSDGFIEQMDALKGQTDMADYVSLRDQRRMMVELPMGEVQTEIGQQLESLARRIGSNHAESATLKKARDALLPPLLSGELRVPDAERFVEGLA